MISTLPRPCVPILPKPAPLGIIRPLVNPRPHPPWPPARRRLMTCCIGMLTSDGFVIAADSQETYSDSSIGFVSKILLTLEGNARVLAAGSGDVHLLDYIKSQILKKANQSDGIKDFETKLQSEMRRMYHDEIAKHPMEQREKEASLLVAVQFRKQKELALFSVDSSVVRRVYDVRVIGVETVSDMARDFHRMQLNTEQAIWACLYVIREAKLRSSFVGGPTSILGVLSSGQLLAERTFDYAQREELLGRIDYISRRLFAAVIPVTPPSVWKATVANAIDLLRITRDDLKRLDKEFLRAEIQARKFNERARKRLEKAAQEASIKKHSQDSQDKES